MAAMRKKPNRSRGATARARVMALCACLVLVLASCTGSGALRQAARVDLFDLGYGAGETQVDFSAAHPGQPENKLSLAFREGMVHISSRAGGALLRLSAYGEALALLYDPARAGKPFLLKPAEPGSTGSDVAARYAIKVPDFRPEEIAADSVQRIYAVDRISGQVPVYNASLGGWCDRVIRRFGPAGREESRLGQEGPGGSPFPPIDRLRILDGDDLFVSSMTATVLLAHRFSPEGTLELVLQIPRDSLPVPEALAKDADPRRRLHVYPDGVDALPGASSPRVVLKCEYIEETRDPVSGAVIGLRPAGSWLFVLDMRSGRVVGETRLSDGVKGGSEDAPLTLAGFVGANYLFIEAQDAGKDSGTLDALRARIVSPDGTVRRRIRLDLPEGAISVPDLEVSAAGIVSALVEMPLGIRLSYWNLGAVDRSAGGAQ